MEDDVSCVFITKYNVVRELCPFPVITRHETSNWNKGERVMVDLVKDWDESTILYQVKGRLYSHNFFYYKPLTSVTISGLK